MSGDRETIDAALEQAARHLANAMAPGVHPAQRVGAIAMTMLLLDRAWGPARRESARHDGRQASREGEEAGGLDIDGLRVAIAQVSRQDQVGEEAGAFIRAQLALIEAVLKRDAIRCRAEVAEQALGTFEVVAGELSPRPRAED